MSLTQPAFAAVPSFSPAFAPFLCCSWAWLLGLCLKRVNDEVHIDLSLLANVERQKECNYICGYWAVFIDTVKKRYEIPIFVTSK